MNSQPFDATFGNDLAAQRFVQTLTSAFERMNTIATTATTAQQALHESIAVSNEVFATLPLPVHNREIERAALEAKEAHVRLLRTLADFNASSSESRTTYNERVASATNTSMQTRASLLNVVAELTDGARSARTPEQKSQEVVDFVTMIFGEQTSARHLVDGDLLIAARSPDQFDALFEKVTARYAATQSTHKHAAETREQMAFAVQPLVDADRIGTNIVDDKLAQYEGKPPTNANEFITRLLAPARARAPLTDAHVQAAVSAAHLRAHPDFEPREPDTTTSGVKYLPSVGEDLSEFKKQYNEQAGLFRRIIATWLESSHEVVTLSTMLTSFDHQAERRERQRVAILNRVLELRTRLETLRQTRNGVLLTSDLVVQAQAELLSDVRRGTGFFALYAGWYDEHLRSIIDAVATEERLGAILKDSARSVGDRNRLFLVEYERTFKTELARLSARLLLIDAERSGQRLSREQKLAAARAEIIERLYESATALQARLERTPALSGLIYQRDANGHLDVALDEQAPPDLPTQTGQLALPSEASARAIRESLRRVDDTAERNVPLPGLNVLADPALDDGEIWVRGFRGRLGPDLVEMYFGASEADSHITDAERIGRLPLLAAYALSVGRINRVSELGYGAVESLDAFEPNSEPFIDVVNVQLQRVLSERLEDLVFRLTLFSTDGDRDAAVLLLDERVPSVLRKVPMPGDARSLHAVALRAITEIVRLMRSESLAAIYRLGDSLSVVNHTAFAEQYGLRNITLAPGAQLDAEQRDRAFASLDSSVQLITYGTNRALAQPSASSDEPLSAQVTRLNTTTARIDAAFKSITVQPFGLAGRVLSGPANGTDARGDEQTQLVYVGHRVPAALIDASLGDLYADIEYRAGTSDQSAANEAALERILASTDTRMLRTITRYDMPNATTGASDIVVDDVFRYTTAREAQRLQIVDVFERASVTLTLRDPVTDRVETRLLDRVVFGAPSNSTTDAQHIIDTLRADVTQASAGQPLLALVAALFVRARFSPTRPRPFENIPTSRDEELTVLERLLALPMRGLRAFGSLYDALEAFWHERNFASQARLALAVVFANVNFLVLLFGVAQALWPGVVYLLRSVGFVDALARALFDAIIGASRSIGLGITWTLVGNLLSIFERMSFRHPLAGAARREAQLLRFYVGEMTRASLSPLQAIPSSPDGEIFIDRLYRFVSTYGSPERRAIARRTFKTMLDALFSPLYSLLAKIPQAVSSNVAMSAYVVAGENVAPDSLFSVAVLGALNVSATFLFLTTLPACDSVWLSFARVFATSFVTRAAWTATFRKIQSIYPQGRTRSRAVNRVLGAGRQAIDVLSVVGPDLLSYATGREYVVLDAVSSSMSTFERLSAGIPPMSGALRQVLFDPTSSSGMLRFVDRATQVTTAYASFAGRFAGRTAWSMLRTYFVRCNAVATVQAVAHQPLAGQATSEDDLPWMDELDRKEKLDAQATRRELTTAFFGRDREIDIWERCLEAALLSRDHRLQIDVHGALIDQAPPEQRYARHEQAFLLARNFLLLATRSLDERQIVTVNAVFVLESVGASADEAKRGYAERVEKLLALANDARHNVLSRALGENIKFELDDQTPEVGRIAERGSAFARDDDDDDDDERRPVPRAYHAWRVFSVETTRFREFGTIVDALLAAPGVRLLDCELYTTEALDEDSRVYFVRQVLGKITDARGVFELIQDLDVERFALEMMSVGV